MSAEVDGYAFAVPGDPVAQGRPRPVMIAGKARILDPLKSRSWKAVCGQYALAAGVRPLDGPVVLTVEAVFKRPNSVRKKDGTKRRPRPSRPDCDNIGKAVADGLSGIAYADDAQVVEMIVRKWVAAAGEMPHVLVKIQRAVPESELAGVETVPQ